MQRRAHQLPPRVRIELGARKLACRKACNWRLIGILVFRVSRQPAPGGRRLERLDYTLLPDGSRGDLGRSRGKPQEITLRWDLIFGELAFFVSDCQIRNPEKNAKNRARKFGQRLRGNEAPRKCFKPWGAPKRLLRGTAGSAGGDIVANQTCANCTVAFPRKYKLTYRSHQKAPTR